MNCSDFNLWLDDGRPEEEETLFLAHAAGCAACTAALRAGLEIEAALRLPVEAAAAGFAERVMQRVRLASSDLPGLRPESFAFPWWVRAAAQPAGALVSLLAALLLWRYQDLWTFALRVPFYWDQAAPRAALPLRPIWALFANPWALLALLLPAAAGLLWLSWKLFLWCSRLFGGSMRNRARRLPPKDPTSLTMPI